MFNIRLNLGRCNIERWLTVGAILRKGTEKEEDGLEGTGSGAREEGEKGGVGTINALQCAATAIYI